MTGVARAVGVGTGAAGPTEMPVPVRGGGPEPATRRRWRWPSSQSSSGQEPQVAAAATSPSSLPSAADPSPPVVPPTTRGTTQPPEAPPVVAEEPGSPPADGAADGAIGSASTPTTPDAPPTAAAPPRTGTDAASAAVPAAGTTSTAESRPLVRTPPRVLRSVARAAPATSPSTRPSRPASLPLRPLAIHDRPSIAAKPEPSGAGALPPARSAPASSPDTPGLGPETPDPAVPTTGPAAPDVPVPAEPPATPSMTEPPTPGDDVADSSPPPVRPTLGAPEPSDEPASPEADGLSRPARPSMPIQRQSDLPPSAGTGLGAPMSSLPPSARPYFGPNAEPAITGHGRNDAIAQGMARLHRSTTPSQVPATTPVADPAPRPRYRTRPGSGPGPDRTRPPVVARRVESAPAIRPVARDVDGAIPTLLPLASRREALVAGPDDEPAEDGDVEVATLPATSPVPVRWQHTSAVEPSPTWPISSGHGAKGPGPVGAPSAPSVHRSADRAATAQAPARPVGAVSTAGRAPARGQPVSSATAAASGPHDHGLGDLPLSFDGHPLVEQLQVSRAAESQPPSRPDGGSELPLVAPRPLAVQRHEDPGTPSLSPTTASHTVEVQRRAEEPAPAAPAPAAPAEPSNDTQVNEMFERLYPRVRDELRWDLRIQRERAGMLADPL